MKKVIDLINLENKKVIINIDFEPLINKQRNINLMLATIQKAINDKAKVILISHLNSNKYDSLNLLGVELASLLNTEIKFIPTSYEKRNGTSD